LSKDNYYNVEQPLLDDTGGKKMLQVKRLTISLLLVMGLMMSATSMAQRQAGLVNVNISQIDVETGNILSDNTVQVSVGAALAIAANICGVAVNVLAVDLGQQGETTCKNATGDQQVTLTQDSRGRR
jgi:hypothetical protein